jgi:hypothetical protein
MAILWGVAWLPAGVALGLTMRWVRFPVTRVTDLSFLAFWTGIGVLSGALLATLERDQTLERLSAHRVAVWGALGGATVPVLSTLVVLAVTNLHLAAEAPPVFLAMAALGSACALATLWLARRRGTELDGVAR